MNEHRGALRRAARKALAARGYDGIEPVRGAGGARLAGSKDGAAVLVMLRTSANRAVGWMRDEAGAWRGLAEATLVVVAALDNEAKPTSAEVYGFAPAVLAAAFDAMLAAQLARVPELAKTAPVFVYLDDRKPGAPPGIKARAAWSMTLKLTEAAPAADARQGFAERVREQFARMMGVPVDKVAVEFRVVL